MQKRTSRWWDLPAAIFLLAALITVAFRLDATNWTEDLNIVTTLTILASLLGLTLGYSLFKTWIVVLFSTAYTLFFIPWQLGSLFPEDVLWMERLSSVGGRIWFGILATFRNQPLTDPLPFLTTMAVLFWIISLIAGYNLTRNGNPWHGILIAGVAMVVIDIYHPELGQLGFGMVVFLIFTILLVTRVYFLINSKRWKQNRITVDSDTGRALGRGALVTVLLLVLLAWNLTTVANAFTPTTRERHNVINFWRGFRHRFENLVNPLTGSVPLPVEFYDNEFNLGTGSILSDDLVMTVEPNITRRIGVNYYWKVRSYDRYWSGMWLSTSDKIMPLTPVDPSIKQEVLQGRVSVHFNIRTARNLGMLFAPSLPVSVSRPVTLIFQPADDGIIDVTAIEIDPMLREGESYQVSSWVAAPTVAQLKNAGEDYPDWVTDNYLQLPAFLPESIHNLAREITEGQETPYEKTEAITEWLRNNIQYSAVIPTPPQDEDVIEWILFKEKKAFCNYYATAEILMLRSLGIPARWTVGYAQGELIEERSIYEVRAKDSHSWPEVYFPGYGWIEFEPTASLPIIDRPSGDNASSQNLGLDQSGGAFQNDPRDRSLEEDPFEDIYMNVPDYEGNLFIRPGTAVLLVLILLVIAAILFFIRMGQRDAQKTFPLLIERVFKRRGWSSPLVLRLWASYSRLTAIERSFITIEWVTSFMGAKNQLQLTPSEQYLALTKIFPQGSEYGSVLLEEYQKAIYSPHPADVAAARQASRNLWRMAVKTRVKNLVEFILSGPQQATTDIYHYD